MPASRQSLLIHRISARDSPKSGDLRGSSQHQQSMKTIIKSLSWPHAYFLAACNYEKMFDKPVPQEESQICRKIPQGIKKQKFDYEKRHMAQAFKARSGVKILLRLHSYIPPMTIHANELIANNSTNMKLCYRLTTKYHCQQWRQFFKKKLFNSALS